MNPVSSTDPSGTERHHALDALRAAAMMLGLLLHGAVSYMSLPVRGLPWPTDAASRSPVLDWLFWGIHGFRVPLFFLLSGYFAALLYEARGAQRFLAHRARRILAPFLVSAVCLLPCLYLIASYGWLRSGRCTIREILTGDFDDLEIRANVFGPAHLWFLEFLLVFSLLFWTYRRLRERFPPSPRSSLPLDKLLVSFWRPLTLAIPSALILAADLGVLTDFRHRFLPAPSDLVYHGSFFLVGTGLYAFRGSLDRLIRHSALYLWLSVPSGIAMIALVATPLSGKVNHTMAWRAGLITSAALFTALSVFGSLGLFLRFFRERRPWVQYLSDASYWIYLAHLPVILLCQVVLREAPFPVLGKYLAAVGLTFSVCLLSYQAYIRYGVIGRWLNGARRPLGKALDPAAGSSRLGAPARSHAAFSPAEARLSRGVGCL